MIGVKVVKVDKEKREVVVKIERRRKPRRLVAFFQDGKIVAQGEDVIFLINPENRRAVYNLRGKYFVYLDPALGATFGLVPEEFVEALKKVAYKPGDLIGHMPAHLGGSPVYFGKIPS